MLYKANLQDRAVVAIWSVKLNWSSITTPRFLAVLEGVMVDEPSCIEKLWWSDELAENTSSSVLARLSWRWWSIIQLEMSLRQAAMRAVTVGYIYIYDMKKCEYEILIWNMKKKMKAQSVLLLHCLCSTHGLHTHCKRRMCEAGVSECMSVSRTFQEGFAVDEVSAVGESGPRAELGVIGRSFLRTLVTLRAPGDSHGAAAGVHTVPARDRSAATLVDVCEVTQLRPQVCTHTHTHTTHSHAKHTFSKPYS